MNFDFNTLITPAPLLLGGCIATILWIVVSAKLKPAQPLYQDTSSEDKARIQKLQNELAAATEHQEKIAEVHAYTLALEQKVKDLESLPGGDLAELGLKVKVLESQLAEKAEVEAKLAVALQQLADYKAKAEIFDSVVGSPVVAEPLAPAEETPAAHADPIEELAAELPVEESFDAPVVQNPFEHTDIANEPAAAQEPVYEPAVIEEVAEVEPEIEFPAAEAPVVEEAAPVAPAAEVPVVEETAPLEPAAQAPVIEQPAYEAPAPVVPAASSPEVPVEELAPAAAHKELEGVGMTVLENDSPQREAVSAGATAPAISERPALRVESVAAPILLDNRDPLEKIDGIGQVYQIKLYEAGILTFAQLAAASPSRITEVIEPQNWQVIDIMKWRREAALYAAGVKE